jgi:hypothetical protein
MNNIFTSIQNKLATEIAITKEKYNEFTSEYLLEKGMNARKYKNNDVFIKMGKLYSEVNFNNFGITTILGYMFGYNNLVYIPEKDRLYETFRPDQLKRMFIGTDVHENVEKYSLNLANFEVERIMRAKTDNDIIVGKLDLALNDYLKTYIIDLKTGKLNKDYVEYQLGAYAYLYYLTHENAGRIIGVAINHEEIYEIELPRPKIESIMKEIIKAKNEIKKDLKNKKLYKF